MGFHTKLYLALSMAGYSDAFFRMACPGRVVRDRVDPIVNPGKVATHVHTVSGGSGFKANMTFADARASKCSSCEIKEDMSNYWTPTLYVHMKDDTFKPVPVAGDPDDVQGGMTVYYIQRPDPPAEKLKAYPEGFRMLAGDTNKRSAGANDLATKAISFTCIGSNKAETNNIPDYKCPGGLRAQVFFPNCWNGKDVNSPDHKSHMSYPNSHTYDTGPCPADFPVHMISVFYEILYDTPLFDDQWDGDKHPFVFANGDPTGYSLHGDFLNGWDIKVFQNAVDTCKADSGNVGECAAVTMYQKEENWQCRMSTSIKEETGGTLKKLPGCNPVTNGPDPAPSGPCDDGVTFGPNPPNYVDLTQSKKWEYAGCGSGGENGERAFKNGTTESDSMTVQKCVEFCDATGMPYAGVENHKECFCADKLNPQFAPKDGIMGRCFFKCAGDSAQTCGGYGALSIYHKCEDDKQCKNVDLYKPAASPMVAGSSGTLESERKDSVLDSEPSDTKTPAVFSPNSPSARRSSSGLTRAMQTKMARRRVRQTWT
ncbi:WSC-domain-containing protein [Ophiobolus disseminans]|uniref:WSC-domain-containing protein n=1 Tax=Ophiobolus disseminans TaxID=1469910 RepID=A0A6A6ZME5_9PLEO|nr:WSC-domain-containing protein [Ophiobolus disseminans]